MYDDFPIALHNVADTELADWAERGHRLCRLPAAVGADLNVAARERARHPPGVELRFVPGAGATVEVTLSAPRPTEVWPFWGDLQGEDTYRIDSEPTTLTVSVPERVRDLDGPAAGGRFHPRVCRLRFAWDVPVALHDVAGDCRPPAGDERPSTRLLAHGTSITEGVAASAPHLTYVSQVARRLGVDVCNLGLSGSAFCEPAMAEYVAGRDDWDRATLALSVNMVNRGFTAAQFRERADSFVGTVAASGPTDAVTLWPYHDDLTTDGDRDRAERFRTILEAVAADHGVPVHAGPDLLDPAGLSTDLLHPGDAGMIGMAERLAERLRQSPNSA